MASTLSKKWINIICQKAQCFVYLLPYNFVQVSPACGPNTYQTMYGDALDFQCQRQQKEHKMPDQKINFCSKFTIKTLSY